MSLFKDLLNNIKKISTQSKKSNLQLEKTISSSKISIKSIKDLKSNVKESKLNNDKSNKAFEEFNLSSNQLFDKIDKYLKKPTEEKLLKVKNQINVSYNDLKIATTVFYESKTLTRKVVDSFNEYKKNVIINNGKIEKLIELNQRLILSFEKNIRITRPTSKLKTRKIYSSENPTQSPDCQKLKEDLAAKIKDRDEARKDLDAFNKETEVGNDYLKKYQENNAERLFYLKTNNKRLIDIEKKITKQSEYANTLDDINIQITRLLKQMQASEIPNQADEKSYETLLENQKDTLALIAENNTAIGSYTKFSTNEEYDLNFKAEKELEANDKNYKEYSRIIKYLTVNSQAIIFLQILLPILEDEIKELRRIIKFCP
jgi:hypothetical protein